MGKYSDLDDLNEKPIDFVGIFLKYISYWKWFLFFVILSLTVAYVYIQTIFPSYEVTSSILLKDDQKGGGTPELSMFKDMGLFTQKNNVDNELEVLQTETLIEQVVREMGINVDYTQLSPYNFLDRFGVDTKHTIWGRYKDKILYGNECPVIVNLPDSILELIGSAEFEILVHSYGEYEFSGTYNDKEYKIKSSISEKYVNMPFGRLNLSRGNFRPKNDMVINVFIQSAINKARQLKGQLKLELTSKTTSVVNITFTTLKPRMGIDFVTKLIKVYNQNDVDDQTAMANKTAEFIDDRLMSISSELGDVETQVENYKQGQGLTDIQSQTNLFIKQTGDFSQKQLEVETQLAIVSDIDNYMRKKENKYQLLPSNTGIQSSGLSELINNYNMLILQKTRLSRIASNTNQAMLDLTYQIESMYNTVQSSVQNEEKNLEIALRDLKSKNNENAAQIRAIPRQEREYTQIKRQQSVKEGLFLFLLQKKEEKYLNMSIVEPVAKVIDISRSDFDPVAPRKKILFLVALIIGLLITFIGIRIRELLRYQVENREELEKLSNVPILGEIPNTDKAGVSIIKENDTDSFTEMIRLLRTNLLFVLDSSDKKVISVVSSISGEGKSFITINLAMSLALLDKKVLIIGLDIRKPKISEYIGLKNETGITLFLTGHMNKEDLVRPTELHPNLSVILAGPIPPNPNELLAKPALDKLISELRSEFDYIVIDSAPIGVVSDSFSLNRLTDVNLYVVRTDYTPKKSIEEATNLYINKKLNNMYFVLNGTDRYNHNYRYGLGQKYEYGYGDDTSKKKGKNKKK